MSTIESLNDIEVQGQIHDQEVSFKPCLNMKFPTFYIACVKIRSFPLVWEDIQMTLKVRTKMKFKVNGGQSGKDFTTFVLTFSSQKNLMNSYLINYRTCIVIIN